MHLNKAGKDAKQTIFGCFARWLALQRWPIHKKDQGKRTEGFLSELFPVNLGVREGDIDSPPLFNLIWAPETYL
jgi:hypothetical protein